MVGSVSGVNIAIGGWEPIESNDPHIKEIAEFAVAEYGEQNGKTLILESVATGQVVEVFLSGSNFYNLIVLVKPSPHAIQEFVSVIVSESRTDKFLKKLVSYVPLI